MIRVKDVSMRYGTRFGSRIVNAPQKTPHTSQLFNKVRLSGRRGMPAGKPTTR